jgi:hypothetical protein
MSLNAYETQSFAIGSVQGLAQASAQNSEAAAPRE